MHIYIIVLALAHLIHAAVYIGTVSASLDAPIALRPRDYRVCTSPQLFETLPACSRASLSSSSLQYSDVTHCVCIYSACVYALLCATAFI